MDQSEINRILEDEQRIVDWENGLNCAEVDLAKVEYEIRQKRVLYTVAENNLEQIEDNLEKFEKLISIFENKSKNADNNRIDNIETIKDLFRKFEDIDFEMLEVYDGQVEADGSKKLNDMVKSGVDLLSEFLIIRETATRNRIIEM